MPTDFYDRLSVTVDKPWKIVAIENRPILPPEIRLHWKRASETRFEADPALLNPGDRVDTVVYLTDTESTDRALPSTGHKEPVLTWNARIANLREFSTPPDLFKESSGTEFGIAVRLSGWALPFTLFAALLFQALYIHLLSRAGYVRDWNWPSVLLVLCTSLLAFAAAESSATYLFPDYLTKMFGVDHWLNVPLISLHALALVFLYWKARTRWSH